MTGLTEKERADLKDRIVNRYLSYGEAWISDDSGDTLAWVAVNEVDAFIAARVSAARAEVLAKVEALAERSAANATMMRARGREGKTPLHKMDGREGNTWDVIAHELRALVADLGGASEPQPDPCGKPRNYFPQQTCEKPRGHKGQHEDATHIWGDPCVACLGSGVGLSGPCATCKGSRIAAALTGETP